MRTLYSVEYINTLCIIKKFIQRLGIKKCLTEVCSAQIWSADGGTSIELLQSTAQIESAQPKLVFAIYSTFVVMAGMYQMKRYENHRVGYADAAKCVGMNHQIRYR